MIQVKFEVVKEDLLFEDVRDALKAGKRVTVLSSDWQTGLLQEEDVLDVDEEYGTIWVWDGDSEASAVELSPHAEMLVEIHEEVPA